jgi:hypothetical protein
MLGKHGTGGVEHERPARIGQGLLSLLALLQLQGRLSAIRVAGQRSDVMQEDTHVGHDSQPLAGINQIERCNVF